MQYRTLGKNGPEIPVIGLGTWPIGGGMGKMDEKIGIKTIQSAIDQGITLIDSAQMYLNAEEIIGKALKNGYRERCFLTTKVSSDFSKAGVEKAMNDSLRKMDVDYVDLYQIHRWDPECPIEETMEAILRLQEQGKLRYIGVSNFRVDHMEVTPSLDKVVSNQVNYNIFLRSIETDMVPYCRKKGIGIMVHSTLAKGLLTGNYEPGHTFAPDDERSEFDQYRGKKLQQYLKAAEELKTIAKDRGMSLVQFAVAWTLRLEETSCALIGAKKPEHLTDPLKAGDTVLTQEDFDAVEMVLDTYQLEMLAPFKSQIV